MMIKIISGGQTGSDQAALDVAIKNNISHGGWITKGRRTENGPLSLRYNLSEINSYSYSKRTEMNILDSDGIIIFSFGKLTGGSLLTKKISKKHQKKYLHINLDVLNINGSIEKIKVWIKRNMISTLNVAGSRESKSPGIYDKTFEILDSVINNKNVSIFDTIF